MEATLIPTSLVEALQMRAAHPGAVPIAGGTDLMVELNFDRRRPPRMMDLTRVPELATWAMDGDAIRLGAGVPYTRIMDEIGRSAPGLSMASRTVGSVQIRNRGTVGGNLGTASPAGDALPPLVALGADVELASVRGTRAIPIGAFCTGPKRNVLADDELIVAVRVPVSRGPEQFAKIGGRNAMVIAVCSFSLAIDRAARSVGTAIGSAAPTVVRAPEAEAFARGVIDEKGAWEGGVSLPESALAEFGRLVGDAARPIDDVRATAAYRRHALSVLARRTLAWTLGEAR